VPTPLIEPVARLIEAFARQAGGTLHTHSDHTGTRVLLRLAP
jgi:hypothetical protein